MNAGVKLSRGREVGESKKKNEENKINSLNEVFYEVLLVKRKFS